MFSVHWWPEANALIRTSNLAGVAVGGGEPAGGRATTTSKGTDRTPNSRAQALMWRVHVFK